MDYIFFIALSLISLWLSIVPIEFCADACRQHACVPRSGMHVHVRVHDSILHAGIVRIRMCCTYCTLHAALAENRNCNTVAHVCAHATLSLRTVQPSDGKYRCYFTVCSAIQSNGLEKTLRSKPCVKAWIPSA